MHFCGIQDAFARDKGIDYCENSRRELVRRGRVDLTPLLTHRFPLDRIADAYLLFGKQRDGVLKVAITP